MVDSHRDIRKLEETLSGSSVNGELLGTAAMANTDDTKRPPVTGEAVAHASNNLGTHVRVGPEMTDQS